MSGSITDVSGLAVGHHSMGSTGVTVIRVTDGDGALAAVDVRGGGPGTRETDLLDPHNTVERVHAIALAGGSAFGLAAADGVMRGLAQQKIGFPATKDIRIPIVPGAVIFDLLVGEQRLPGAAQGVEALKDSYRTGQEPRRGSVGAGCGATAGRLRGGVGQAAVQAGDYRVAALVVANPMGEVINPADGAFWAEPTRRVDPEAFARLRAPGASLNTTIGVIATDAPLTSTQAKRLAVSGHDGLARAVRPAHLPMDGDTLFALSTAWQPLGVEPPVLARLCAAAAEVVSRAIVDAVVSASAGGELTVTAYREIAS
ncbi:P1 family peptidase [Corynebacterium sp. zg-331]|uniref:P1 family peptidase n=1 Tax=unclassified Corynebacterium TaxID=2624378 RepID=UPI00128C6B3F|nr:MULTISPECIES: P1 family peptidase [unclassified Corynebacterium]MBC3186919.1 P1 family peptidase [Corynebacterium sp. zg-331]MPV53398.1 peptidase S58 family protein [Corynebacterium sp. zg331]